MFKVLLCCLAAFCWQQAESGPVVNCKQQHYCLKVAYGACGDGMREVCTYWEPSDDCPKAQTAPTDESISHVCNAIIGEASKKGKWEDGLPQSICDNWEVGKNAYYAIKDGPLTNSAEEGFYNLTTNEGDSIMARCGDEDKYCGGSGEVRWAIPVPECNPACEMCGINEECSDVDNDGDGLLDCKCKDNYQNKGDDENPICVECISDDQCGSEQLCMNNMCKCKEGFIDDGAGKCVPEGCMPECGEKERCTTENECECDVRYFTLSGDDNSFTCVECIESTDCSEKEDCNNNVCECKQGYIRDNGECIIGCLETDDCDSNEVCNNKECECASGFFPNSQGVCAPGCSSDSHCPVGKHCENGDCVCNPPYVLNAAGDCVPDVCTCPAEEICKKVSDVYKCECKDDYMRNQNGDCIPVCDCSQNEQCVEDNASGMFICECKPGYTDVDGMCKKVDCVKDDDCETDQVCTDNKCTCKPDYYENPAGDCVPDLCQCGSNQMCQKNDDGTYQCVCKKAYIPENDRCIPGCNCPPKKECVLINQTPACLCKTPYKPKGNSCTPKDSACNCPAGEKCEVNSSGGHDCVCKEGYERKGGKCVRVDCDTASDCGENSDCVANKCVCVMGYRENPVGQCVPVQCACGNNQMCKRKNNNFECVCKDDYVLENGICVPECNCPAEKICILSSGKPAECVCPIHTQAVGDKCVPSAPACSCKEDEVCIEHTPQNFECVCKNGYVKEDDKCVKIDNCNCGEHEECVPLSNGNYRCNCEPGYVRDNDGKCVKKDKPCQCSKQEQCVLNDDGEYECRCRKGYERVGKACVKSGTEKGSLCAKQASCMKVEVGDCGTCAGKRKCKPDQRKICFSFDESCSAYRPSFCKQRKLKCVTIRSDGPDFVTKLPIVLSNRFGTFDIEKTKFNIPLGMDPVKETDISGHCQVPNRYCSQRNRRCRGGGRRCRRLGRRLINKNERQWLFNQNLPKCPEH